MKTWKNKVTAILLVLAGSVPVWLSNDATVLVFTSMFAVPLFFAKRQWVY